MSICLRTHALTLEARLNRVSVEIPAARCCHIMGENGAGKSSLLASLAGLLLPDSGQVLLNDIPVEQFELTELAGFRSFHHQNELPVFDLTVAELLGFYRNSDVTEAVPAILEDALEILHLLPRKLGQLSGGEQQRVNLCRALLQAWPAIEPGKGLVLLDEPLSGLDIRHQYALVTLLRSLAQRGNTVLMTSHDIQISANYADWLCFMKQGSVIASGTPDTVLTSSNLSSTFGCEFEIRHLQNSVQIFVANPTVNPELC
ncbi:ABC transporter ATP-binding protein [Alteromonas aestuariivivens]|nr:ABC transporter ATP-binding protein [Alteromonas aestuariivivens]